MCLNCGCGESDNRHGDDANITMDDLRKAGDANDQDLDRVMANIEKTYHASDEAQKATKTHAHSS